MELAKEKSVRLYFFNICVSSQCMMYWINFQNIYTFIYQKPLLSALFCLFLKSSKALSVSLRKLIISNDQQRMERLKVQIYSIFHWRVGLLRSSHRGCSMKKGVHKNFAKSTGKHQCQSLFFNKVAGWGTSFFLWIFAKF